MHNDLEKQYKKRLDKLAELYDEEQSSDKELLYPLQTDHLNIDERYLIKEKIGEGGAKVIYRATDLRTSRDIAFAKITETKSKHKDLQESFLREAQFGASLQHPNIMPIYDIGLDEEGQAFFTMKLMGSDHLGKALKTLNLSSLLEVYIKTCEAIAFAHSKSILHLDLKPENILMGQFGEVLVADWGLAKLRTVDDLETKSSLEDHHLKLSHVTLSGSISGTPGFMAPEQIDKSLNPKDKRTDIYALGAILYTLLTKEISIDETDFSKYKTRLSQGNITKPSERSPQFNIPLSLEAICLKAMNNNAQDRYQNVAELIEDIQAYQHGFATKAEDANLFKVIKLSVKRHKLLVSFCLSLLVLSFIGLYSLYQSRIETFTAENNYQKEKTLHQEEQVLRNIFMRHNYKASLSNFKVKFKAYNLQTNWSLLTYFEKESPDDIELKPLRFRLLFVEMKFAEALALFNKYQWRGDQDLLNLANKYQTIKKQRALNLEDFENLFLSLIKESREPLAIQFVADTLEKSEAEFSNKFLAKILTDSNPPQKTPYKATLIRSGEELSLDLSHNPKLENFAFLRLLPVTKLNIYETNVPSVEQIKFFPLKELRMNGRTIKNWQDLRLMDSLKKVIITAKDTKRDIITFWQERSVEIEIK